MNLYLPGAKVISGLSGGNMLGGPAKVVWHTTENDPARTTAIAIAEYLLGSGNTVHLVWNPITGETVAMIPANVAGRGLENRAGGVETNRAGSVVIQIEVVGYAAQPFTDGPLVGLPKILAWVASLGVPPVWSGTTDRSTTNWAKAGHFGHADVPENSHTDPGHIDKTKLTTPPEVDMPLTQAEIEHIAVEVWRYDQAGTKPQAWGFLQKAATLPAPIDFNALAAAIVAAGGVGVTAAAIAKAVNDDAAKRLLS